MVSGSFPFNMIGKMAKDKQAPSAVLLDIFRGSRVREVTVIKSSPLIRDLKNKIVS